MSVSFKTNRTYKRKDIYEETDFNVIHGFFTRSEEHTSELQSQR